MKVIAFNGSPRKKKWNTVTLLKKALEGAASLGAETELIQLYDLNYSGCISCFACKKKDRKQKGVCILQDDLAPILDRVREADALVLGSPVYYMCETAGTRALIERLCYPYNSYRKDLTALSIFPKPIKTALIYTMNMTEEQIEQYGVGNYFAMMQNMLNIHFMGGCELLLSTNTLQYNDYDKYDSEAFDKNEKLSRHAEVFPKDCKRAFELGVRVAS